MTRPVRRIYGICDSSSFFVPDSEPPTFARRLAGLACKAEPVVCYVGAARGDNPQRIAAFRNLMARVGAKPVVLELYDPPSGNADEFFEGVDIVFIDGGSTRNLMALFREWGVGDALRAAYASGVVVAGASAGLNILFEWSITDSIKTQIEPTPGLGVLKGCVCVHFDVSTARVNAFWDFTGDCRMVFPAYTLDEGTAIEFQNERLENFDSIREKAGIRRVSRSGGEIDHCPMPVRFLGQAGVSGSAC